MPPNTYPFKFKVEAPSSDPAALYNRGYMPPSTSMAVDGDPAGEHAALQAQFQARSRQFKLEATSHHDSLDNIKKEPDTSLSRKDPDGELRKKKSSETLRASKTFAAFREYVQEYMMWVTIDQNDPADLAAYNKFIAEVSPAISHAISDENLEFLFRHVSPKPQNIEEDTTPGLPFKQFSWKRKNGSAGDAKRVNVWPAIKNMPPDVQTDILERARASRAKYRAQHRFQLIMKERCRRENKSRENQTLDEFIRRRRLRESKLGASAKQREIQRCQSPMEADELTE
ncbi:hypothetical protein C8R43DRAFT_1141253 [Mycena crocata]|nr:hypothetical protein C8R43DRAFT_1141253 [Mycena crocata]